MGRFSVFRTCIAMQPNRKVSKHNAGRRHWAAALKYETSQCCLLFLSEIDIFVLYLFYLICLSHFSWSLVLWPNYTETQALSARVAECHSQLLGCYCSPIAPNRNMNIVTAPPPLSG